MSRLWIAMDDHAATGDIKHPLLYNASPRIELGLYRQIEGIACVRDLGDEVQVFRERVVGEFEGGSEDSRHVGCQKPGCISAWPSFAHSVNQLSFH